MPTSLPPLPRLICGACHARIIAYAVTPGEDDRGPLWRWTVGPCGHDLTTAPGRAPWDGQVGA